MATIKELQQGRLDLATHRTAFLAAIDQVEADANAFSIRARGRPLPPPNRFGQLPAEGVQIREVVGSTDRGEEIRTTIIPPADVTWQNLANRIRDVRAPELDKLDHLDRQLQDLIAAQEARAGAAGPGGPPPAPGKDTRKIRAWVDFAALILSYVLVFYGLMAWAHIAGFFTFGIVFALLALSVLLGINIISPLQLAVRAIVGAILDIIDDLIEFVIEWFKAIIQYFQGDFLRAILQIIILAAFAWIWSLFQTIPGVRAILDLIGNAIRAVTDFVNTIFDTVTRFLEDTRHRVADALRTMLASLGPFGKQLTSSILGVVDRLFTGLESRINRVRFEALSQVDLISKALGATVTIFGFRLQLLPDEVRQYLNSFYRAKPLAAVQNAGDLVAAVAGAHAIGAVDNIAVWDIADEVDREIRALIAGRTNDVGAVATELVTFLQQLNRGETPVTPEIPPGIFKTPAPGPPVPPTAAAPARPPWVPVIDWQAVQGVCGADHVAYLAAAIGQHETAWGRTGRGPDGYVLGVGVLPDRTLVEFQGLTNQLDFACPRLRAAFPGPETVTQAAVIVFARDVWKPADPVSWGSGVFALYASTFLGTITTLA